VFLFFNPTSFFLFFVFCCCSSCYTSYCVSLFCFVRKLFFFLCLFGECYFEKKKREHEGCWFRLPQVVQFQGTKRKMLSFKVIVICSMSVAVLVQSVTGQEIKNVNGTNSPLQQQSNLTNGNVGSSSTSNAITTAGSSSSTSPTGNVKRATEPVVKDSPVVGKEPTQAVPQQPAKAASSATVKARGLQTDLPTTDSKKPMSTDNQVPTTSEPAQNTVKIADADTFQQLHYNRHYSSASQLLTQFLSGFTTLATFLVMVIASILMITI